MKEATPFPPLNFIQTGKICPIIESAPIIIPFSIPKKIYAKNVGKKVLKKSRNKVNAANFLPNNLLTLVAPIFPDPNLLMSFFFKNLNIKYPNGIDPIK